MKRLVVTTDVTVVEAAGEINYLPDPNDLNLMSYL